MRIEQTGSVIGHMTSVRMPMNTEPYSLLVALYDGSFFSEWWVWVNDYAAFALLILTVTGTIRWYRKKKTNKGFL